MLLSRDTARKESGPASKEAASTLPRHRRDLIRLLRFDGAAEAVVGFPSGLGIFGLLRVEESRTTSLRASLDAGDNGKDGQRSLEDV